MLYKCSKCGNQTRATDSISAICGICLANKLYNYTLPCKNEVIIMFPKMSLNSVTLVGNLGNDPELRYTTTGTAVCNMSIATSEQSKDDEGNYNDVTEWHRIVAWGKTAEFIGTHIKKGKKVIVTGRLQTRSWEDKDAVKRYSTEIVAAQVIHLDPIAKAESDDDNKKGKK